MLKSIELQKNVITVESLALFRPNQKTLDRLGGFFTDAGDAIRKLLGNITSANVAVAIDGRNFLPLIKKADYTPMAGLRVPFPKEFSADYATIIDIMLDVNAAPESLYRDFLQPFSQWVGITLNDPTKMESINQYVNIDLNRSKVARSHLDKVIKGGSQPEVRYSRAVRRNSDWEKIIDGINQIAAQNSNVSIDDVRVKVKEIDDLLQVLIGKMNEPSFEFRPSGAFVDKLVNLTYAMAAEIEFYAEFQYLFGSLVENVRNDVVLITKYLQ